MTYILIVRSCLWDSVQGRMIHVHILQMRRSTDWVMFDRNITTTIGEPKNKTNKDSRSSACARSFLDKLQLWVVKRIAGRHGGARVHTQHPSLRSPSAPRHATTHRCKRSHGWELSARESSMLGNQSSFVQEMKVLFKRNIASQPFQWMTAPGDFDFAWLVAGPRF